MRPILSLVMALAVAVAVAGPAVGQSPPVAAEVLCGPMVTTAAITAALGSAVTDGGGVELADRTPPDRHAICTWALETGDLTLEIDDAASLEAYDEAAGGTPVADLGTTAFAGSSDLGAWLAWTVATDGGDRSLVLRSDALAADQLAVLAAAIRADAAPGEAAPEAVGEPETIGDPAVLVGTWTLTSTDFGSGAQPWPVTFTFSPDGKLTIEVACKPSKGGKAPLRRYDLELISTTDVPGFHVSDAKSPVIKGCRDGSMDWMPVFTSLPASPVVFFIPDATGAVEIWAGGGRVMTIARQT